MHLSSRNWLVAIGLILFLFTFGGMYVLFKQLSNVQQALEIRKEKIEPVVREEVKEEVKELVTKPAEAKKQLWSRLQAKLKDAVVQVFAQITEFNWVEPYKTPMQQEVTGSAFFINKDGYLITNAHVIDQAILVQIQVPSIGKRRYTVDIIGVSPDRDLALLQLKKDDLAGLKKDLKVDSVPFLRMGDSDAVQRGDKLMALGFPLGQQGLKSTTGVVSGREHMGGYFIQISAPLNKGNSGGPSLDRMGEVIGVNTALIQGAQNVGYIIPINEVILFLDQLSTIPQGKGPKLLRKPYFGVFFNNSGNENLTAFLGNPPPGGLYVVDVYKGSPFDKAGIKTGDMIYKIDNYAIDMYGEMNVPWSKEERISIMDYVARLKFGHTIRLEYYRNGVKKNASLLLEPSEPPIRRMYPGYEKIDYEVLAGFVFMAVTLNHVILLAQYAPELMQYADSKKQIQPAVLITHAMLNSPASRARTVGAGGLVSQVNGERVRTLDDLRSVVHKSTKTGYLTIKTTDNQFVALPLNEILEDEPRLAATYHYPLSISYKSLLHKMGASQGQKVAAAA